MSQSSLNVDNSNGLLFRTSTNNALQALATMQSGASFPSSPYPFQYYIQTPANKLWQRNSTNTSWISVESRVEANRSTSYTITVPGSPATFIFNTEVIDTDNQYNPTTGEFTCSHPGIYQINCSVGPTATAAAALFYLSLFVNGTEVNRLMHLPCSASETPLLIGNQTIRLNNADVVTIRAAGYANMTCNPFAIVNWLNIQRIGGYV